jgi:hypothetical protein
MSRIQERVPTLHPGDVVLEAFHLLARHSSSEAIEDARDVEACVPDVDVAHLREAGDGFAVLTHHRHDD